MKRGLSFRVVASAVCLLWVLAACAGALPSGLAPFEQPQAEWRSFSARVDQPTRRAGTNQTVDDQCLYLATLKTSLSSGSVGIKGTVLAVNSSGQTMASFSTMPLALAIDSVDMSLFVSTPVSILEFNVAASLASDGKASCPCSFSTLSLDSVVQTLAVDEVRRRLFFATDTKICYRAVDEGSIFCFEYEPNDNHTFQNLYIPYQSSLMYVTTNEAAEVYVVSLVNDATFMQVLDIWKPFGSAGRAFSGMTVGSTGNLFMISPMSESQPCVVIEVDWGNGTVVSCFIPTLERKTYFEAVYGLLYNNFSGLYYTMIESSYSNVSIVNGTSNSTYDVQLFDLVASPNASGQLVNHHISYLITGLTTPVDGALGPCPRPASPSPSPVINAGGSSDTNVVAIAVPVVLGSLLLLLLCGVVGAGAFLIVSKRRRKYFDAGDPDGDGSDPEVGGIEMGAATKFTFREIDGRDLRLGKLLGEGAFGKVYKGEYRGAVVAIKLFEALRLDRTDEKVLNELRMEAQMMDRLSNHPNIVKFVGAITKNSSASEGGTNFALVTEFCPRGSLFDLLVKNKKKLPLITLVRMARDAASGILHLHKEHIVHRDIAARNILVGQNYEVYVSDFGLARVQEVEGQVATTKQNFGPLAWMAPEALKSREYSEATDAFSFGVVLWEMMVRKRPWAGVEPVQIISAVTSNTRLRIPKDCDPIFAQLMKMCWRQNPSQRPPFEKLVEMLSNYYKKLHKLHDISSDAFEVSDQESPDDDSEDEMALEGMSYEEVQLKRIKDEVKSFMKQLISERNDDFGLVARANTAAFVELKEAFHVAADEYTDDDDDDDDDEDGDNDDDDEVDNGDHGGGGQQQQQKKGLQEYSSTPFDPTPPAVAAGVGVGIRSPSITYAELGRTSSNATPPASAPTSDAAPVAQAASSPLADQWALVGEPPKTGADAARNGSNSGGQYFVMLRKDEAEAQAPAEPTADKRRKRTSSRPRSRTLGEKKRLSQLPPSAYVDLGQQQQPQHEQQRKETAVVDAPMIRKFDTYATIGPSTDEVAGGIRAAANAGPTSASLEAESPPQQAPKDMGYFAL